MSVLAIYLFPSRCGDACAAPVTRWGPLLILEHRWTVSRAGEKLLFTTE